MSELLKELEKAEQKKIEEEKKPRVEHWKPKKGDVLVGTVTEKGTTITEYGDKKYIQVKAKENGSEFLIFLNSILDKAVKKFDVKAEDQVAIKYLGKVKSEKNPDFTYNDYVLVKEAGGS